MTCPDCGEKLERGDIHPTRHCLLRVKDQRDAAIKRAEAAEALFAVCEPDRIEKQKLLTELGLLPIGVEHFEELPGRIREILDQRDTARREAEEARADWNRLCEQIALQVGDEDDHDAADATDPAFIEQFDPWDCLRRAGQAFEKLGDERALREKAERERDEVRANARAELIAELTRKTDAILEDDPLAKRLAEAESELIEALEHGDVSRARAQELARIVTDECAARERAEATVTGVVTERDAAIKRAEAAEAVVEAAEAFLSFQCSCDVLQDQGCICSVCLLKEKFVALNEKP